MERGKKKGSRIRKSWERTVKDIRLGTERNGTEGKGNQGQSTATTATSTTVGPSNDTLGNHQMAFVHHIGRFVFFSFFLLLRLSLRQETWIGEKMARKSSRCT